METRANYVLIGAFTLAAILGGLFFFGWLAKIQIDRQYMEYDILFDDVSGLSRASDVRFNGLSVGRVLTLTLYKADPSKVRVTIEIAAETPIKSDTRAQMQTLAVTGVSFVSLAGGSAEAQLLRDMPGNDVPIIPSERSVLQALTEDAPDLVSEAINVMRNLQEFTGPQNQRNVASIVQNIADASGRLDQALSDFSDISGTVAEATQQIKQFTGRLDVIAAGINTTLATLNDTMLATKTTITKGGETLDAVTTTFGSANSFITQQLPPIAADVSRTLGNADATISDVGGAAKSVVTRFGTTADLASARLTELQGTITTLDKTLEEAYTSMAAVESASVVFEDLVYGDGTLMVEESRDALKALMNTVGLVDKVLSGDVPVIMGDIRQGVESATKVIDQVGTDVTGFTGRLAPLTDTARSTLEAATATLQRASQFMGRLDTTLDTADRAMTSATGTFDSATTILQNDAAPALAEIKTAAINAGTAMNQVSADIPAITAQLRETMARAADAVDRIDAMVASATPPVRAFAETGLPEFTRFARAAQALTARLDSIARKLDRDPARFFFGNSVPEFRR